MLYIDSFIFINKVIVYCLPTAHLLTDNSRQKRVESVWMEQQKMVQLKSYVSHQSLWLRQADN